MLSVQRGTCTQAGKRLRRAVSSGIQGILVKRLQPNFQRGNTPTIVAFFSTHAIYGIRRHSTPSKRQLAVHSRAGIIKLDGIRRKLCEGDHC